MVIIQFISFKKTKHSFLFSEYIEKSPSQSIIRTRFGRNTINNKRLSSNTLSRIAFWGVTLTVGGLAIYLWNQSQLIDPTKFMNLGDFLAQFYR